MGAWYATRESVRRALDIQETAQNNAKIDRAIAGATESIEGSLNRVFIPIYETRKLDWPDEGGHNGPFRVLFGPNECISLDVFTAGVTVIPSSNYLLRNFADRPRPPYTYLEILLSSTSALAAGTTWQQSLIGTGLWGYRNDEADAGTLVGGINASVTTLTVSNGALVGVGSVLRIGTERMIVTGRTWVASGQTTAGSYTATASTSDVGILLNSAATIFQDETTLIDSERMLVTDVAGSLIVSKRAVDGSVLASHAPATAVFVSRVLTVQRGALGTTAAAHNNADPILVVKPPDLVNQLCIAESLNGLLQDNSGWARTVGAGDNVQNAVGAGLEDLRARTQTTHGRQLRGPYTV
jgi:hypothetical protein